MRHFKFGWPVLCVLSALQLSCGAALDPGASISLAVSPSKAYIVPGKGVSCVALAEASIASETPVADIEGDRVTFNRFALNWRSGAKLTLASVRVTIFSDGIAGADALEGVSLEVSEDEVAALLGLTNLTIGFENPYRPDRVVDIDSTDSARKGTANPPYAACGLQIGGIASKKDVKSYNARIKVEVIGFSTECVLNQTNGTCDDGEQRPVRKSVTVQAQKF